MAADIHIHHDRNSAQVDLCARGTRCPIERLAAFSDISPAVQGSMQ